MEVIRTENLTKRYKEVKATSDINLHVRKGEIYGFLGLNGAGKTTTIRMLLGLINPSSGTAYLNGVKVQKGNRKLWEKVGYLVEVPYSYPNLTVKENLEIIRNLRFIKNKNSVNNIINQLELDSYRNRKAKNLSLGNSQRLGLAKALIHNPEILILDEPTNGLDPSGIHDIREMLKELAEKQGVTIFISSHILGEISRFATRIGIIHKGKIVKEIDSNKLDLLCEKQLAIRTNNLSKTVKLLENKGYNITTNEDTILVTDKESIKYPEKIATLLVNNDLPPKLLHIQEEDLESYFLRTIKLNGGIK